MQYFQSELNVNYLDFFIQTQKIIGYYNFNYLAFFSSFKNMYSSFKINFFDFIFRFTKLSQNFGDIIQSTDSVIKYIYPYNYINQYKRIFEIYNFKNIFYLNFLKFNIYTYKIDFQFLFFYKNLKFKKNINKIKKFIKFKLLNFRQIFFF